MRSEIIHARSFDFETSKSKELAARVRFEIKIMISDQTCTTRSSIPSLIHPFGNLTYQYFIDPVVGL